MSAILQLMIRCMANPIAICKFAIGGTLSLTPRGGSQWGLCAALVLGSGLFVLHVSGLLGPAHHSYGMVCPEKLRLQQLYDASVRRWAQIQASSQLFGQPTHMTLEVRKRALAERVAAKARLIMHQQNCKTCRSAKL
jgi:hypothetical protein